MKCADLENALNSFVTNKGLMCILIDGKWGIGKTYAINKWIEKHHGSDVKFVKSSFFGKTSLDEINTELYNGLQSAAGKVIDFLLNKTVKLVEASISNAIKISSAMTADVKISKTASDKRNKTKQIKNKNEEMIIVVLDDLERKSEMINMHDVIGYINSLVSQNIKVIVVANEEKLSETNATEYIEYKEKVIDRAYKIDDADEDTIRSLLGDNAKYFNNICKELLENNLRLLIKTNTLFNDVKDWLAEEEIKCSDDDLKTILLYCIVTIQESQMNKFFNYHKKVKDSLSKNSAESINNAIYGRFGPMSLYFNNILKMQLNKRLIEALLRVFEESDCSRLMALFIPQNDTNPLAERDFYYLSDANKIIRIKQQAHYISSLKTADNATIDQIEKCVEMWFDYANILDPMSIVDEAALFEDMYRLNVRFSFPMRLRNSKELQDFLGKFREYVKKKEEEVAAQKLDTLIAQSANACSDYIGELRREFYNLPDSTKKIIKDRIITNKFYIENRLHGDITDENWRLAHSVCSFVNEYFGELKPTLLDELNNYASKHNDDKSLQDRIASLVKQYGIDKTQTN